MRINQYNYTSLRADVSTCEDKDLRHTTEVENKTDLLKTEFDSCCSSNQFLLVKVLKDSIIRCDTEF